jgi:hypothetical protein
MSVLQVRVQNFHPDLLMEKKPIVIEERLVDQRDLLKTALAYYYVYAKDSYVSSMHLRKYHVDTYGVCNLISPSPIAVSNKEKNMNKTFTIYASPLFYGNLLPIQYKLRLGQVLILPPHWRVWTPRKRDKRASDEGDGLPFLIRITQAFDILHGVFFPFGYFRHSLVDWNLAIVL